MTDDEALGRAEAVFVGELREIREPTVQVSSASESRFIFAVERVLKGEVHETQSIVSASSSASCGLELDLGTDALVFAGGWESDETPDDGEFAANLCLGTRRVSTGAVPASFGPGSSPMAGSSPIGEDESLPSEVVGNWYWIVIAIAALPAAAILVGHRKRRAKRGDASI